MKIVPQCEDKLPTKWDIEQDVFYEQPPHDTPRKIVLLAAVAGETAYVIKKKGFENF